MLIVIVAVFILCHSIRSIINTYECIQMAVYGELRYWPDWVQFLVHVNHLALVVNSSINILIYSCKDDKFLRVLLVTLRIRPASSTSSAGASSHARGRNRRRNRNNNNNLGPPSYSPEATTNLNASNERLHKVSASPRRPSAMATCLTRSSDNGNGNGVCHALLTDNEDQGRGGAHKTSAC